MLGRLRMSVEECLNIYPQIAQNVFGRPRRWYKHVLRGAKFDHEPLRAEIEQLISRKCPSETLGKHRHGREYDVENFPSSDDVCKT
jgi:hypothetical protein